MNLNRTRYRREEAPLRLATPVALLLFLIGLLSVSPVELRAQLGNPCDSVSITPEYDGPGCCWDFVLTNNSSLQPFNSIRATVVSSGGTVESATGGFPATTTAITATWTFQNGIGRGNTRVAGCFKSPGQTITLLFEWRYNGVTYCTDTLTLDCPDGEASECDTDTLRMSTGWNRTTGLLETVGSWTSTWQVVEDPYPGTVEPRPAAVLPTDTAWDGPLGTSRWIGNAHDGAHDTIGTYAFQTCFCVKGEVREAIVKLDILADDRARVYVNGTQVGSNPASNSPTLPEGKINLDITQYLVAGRNCMTVELDNTESTRMGLNVDGTLTATGLGLQKASCCQTGGTIIGMKFNDLNCNGQKDAGEPGLPGFRIVSTHGDTTFTDQFGTYVFRDVPTGAYTLYEINKPAWQQTYPPSEDGTHTVQVFDGVVAGPYDFGNCRDTVKEEGCFEYLADSTECEAGRGGDENRFRHRFALRSLLDCEYSQVASLRLVSPPGITLSQTSFLVSDVFYPQQIEIGGPDALPGEVVRLEVELCCIAGGAQGGDTVECCSEIIEILLPECDTTGGGGGNEVCTECCLDFPKNFPRLSQWSSSSGISTVTGQTQAGNAKICTVSATLVEARVNGLPVSGRIVPTNLLDGQAGVITTMHEVVWTDVDVNPAARPFNLRIQLPGLPFNSIVDRVEYCVRFRYTDVNCVTCDTLVCFEQTRIRWIFPGESFDALDDEKGVTPGLSSAATFEGSLTGEESGELDVTFPEPPAQLGTVRYVGLEIQPAEEFVEITGGIGTDYTFRTKGFGIEAGPFEASAGEETSVAMTYFGLNNRNRFDHWVTLRFVSDNFPGDTLEESGRVTLFRTEFVGGDSLELGSKQEDVRTWALYLHNRNGSDESLARLQLDVPNGVEIVAVGPGENPQSATIAFLDDTRDRAAIDLEGVSGLLEADGTIGPIYVTLAGTLKRFDIGFRTMNSGGTEISEGSITVDDDPSSVSDGRDLLRGGTILNGVYPNPTDDRATISFTLPGATDDLEIFLLDGTGRTVARLLERNRVAAGEHTLSLDTEGLPEGAYHVLLRHGTQTERRAMQIVR